MKKENNKIQTKFQFYLDQFEDTSDPKFAVEIAKMIIAKELSVSVVRSNTELMYSEHSKFKNKCNRCGLYYKAGDPAFYGCGEKFHEHCATAEEKENNTYYQKALLNRMKSQNTIQSETEIQDGMPAYKIMEIRKRENGFLTNEEDI